MLILLAIPAFAESVWESEEAALMGTRVQVGVVHEDADVRRSAIDAALAEISRIEALMSTYIESSEISAVNRRAAQEWVPISAELYDLLEVSLEFSALSGGAFDITYDSLGQHYDFRGKLAPSEAERERAAALVDFRHVALDHKRGVRFRRDGLRINLGGIAKGYAVEQAIATLRQWGITSALVSAGGDTRLLGSRQGQPWLVGIQNPRDNADLAVRLPLIDEAISTSGDYERYFERDGVRYHHIFSPAEGRAASGLRSASVVGPSAWWTDALSTTVFVLGARRGLALIETLPDYEAVVIDDQQQMVFSSGFADASPAAPVAH